MKNFLFKKSIDVIISLSMVLASFLTVSAASIDIEFNDALLIDQGVVEASVLIDTTGESINTFKGTLVYPPDILTVSDIRTANSLINFWVESPTDNSGEITFAGITPGGFNGQQGLLFQVYFIPKKTGSATLVMKDQELFKNDGEGTPLSNITVFARTIALKTIPESPDYNYISEDNRDPEDFEIIRTRDNSLFDGKWFVTFMSQDKGSGIARYEICERLFSCVSGTSPHLLEKQTNNYRITIHAFDKNNNKTTERLFSTPFIIKLVGIMSGGVILIFVGIYRFFIANYKKHIV